MWSCGVTADCEETLTAPFQGETVQKSTPRRCDWWFWSPKLLDPTVNINMAPAGTSQAINSHPVIKYGLGIETRQKPQALPGSLMLNNIWNINMEHFQYARLPAGSYWHVQQVTTSEFLSDPIRTFLDVVRTHLMSTTPSGLVPCQPVMFFLGSLNHTHPWSVVDFHAPPKTL